MFHFKQDRFASTTSRWRGEGIGKGPLTCTITRNVAQLTLYIWPLVIEHPDLHKTPDFKTELSIDAITKSQKSSDRWNIIFCGSDTGICIMWQAVGPFGATWCWPLITGGINYTHHLSRPRILSIQTYFDMIYMELYPLRRCVFPFIRGAMSMLACCALVVVSGHRGNMKVIGQKRVTHAAKHIENMQLYFTVFDYRT